VAHLARSGGLSGRSRRSGSSLYVGSIRVVSVSYR